MKLEDLAVMDLTPGSVVEVRFYATGIDRDTGEVCPNLEKEITHLGFYTGIEKSEETPVLCYERSCAEGKDTLAYADSCRQRIDYIFEVSKLETIERQSSDES